MMQHRLLFQMAKSNAEDKPPRPQKPIFQYTKFAVRELVEVPLQPLSVLLQIT